MAEPDQNRATRLLLRVAEGHDSAIEKLLPLAYEELRSLASAMLRDERPGHTLQPTALVHEAYLKLVDQTRVPWSDAVHFRRVAARAMRQILVDHARRKGAAKRGGDRLRVTLHEEIKATPGTGPESGIDVLALDEALEDLAETDARKAQVVELIFFGGMTHEEAATVLEVSRKTIEADWYFSRAWLARRLGWENGR